MKKRLEEEGHLGNELINKSEEYVVLVYLVCLRGYKEASGVRWYEQGGQSQSKSQK